MKETASAAELLETPKALVEVLLTNHSTSKTKTTKTGSAKATAAVQLWNQAAMGSAKRAEILKAGGLQPLLQLLERGDGQERYAAAGALAELMAAPAALQEVAGNSMAVGKVLSASLALLSGPHNRSHLPAAKLLALLSTNSEVLPRLEALLPVLVQLLQQGNPGWSGLRQVQTAAATCIRALLQPTELEQPEVMEVRRITVMESQGVPSLLALAGSGNAKLSLVAAACLRFLALSPDFVAVAAAEGNAQLISRLVPLLKTSSDATRAFLCGLLWELATEPRLAEQLVAADAVQGLLKVVQDTAQASGGGKKKKKGQKGKKKEEGQTGPLLQQDLEANPALAASTALVNATGALHHLSFLDDGKVQLGDQSAVKVLSGLHKSASGQLYDNVVGVLWNLATCADNRPVLQQANIPQFLSQPVPSAHMCAY